MSFIPIYLDYTLPTGESSYSGGSVHMRRGEEKARTVGLLGPLPPVNIYLYLTILCTIVFGKKYSTAKYNGGSYGIYTIILFIMIIIMHSKIYIF